MNNTKIYHDSQIHNKNNLQFRLKKKFNSFYHGSVYLPNNAGKQINLSDHQLSPLKIFFLNHRPNHHLYND